MSAITLIIAEAKKLKKQFPNKFSKWTDYVKEASKVYRDKSKSQVSKKITGTKVKYKIAGLKIDEALIFKGYKIIRHEEGYLVRDKNNYDIVGEYLPTLKLAKSAIYDSIEFDKKNGVSGWRKAAMIEKRLKVERKGSKKNTGTKTHKDTKSHNVNIKVVSGTLKTIPFVYKNLDRLQEYYKYKGKKYRIQEDQDGRAFIIINKKVTYFNMKSIAGWRKGSTHIIESNEKPYKNVKNVRVRRIPSGDLYSKPGTFKQFNKIAGQNSSYVSMYGIKYNTQREIVVGSVSSHNKVRSLENFIPEVKVKVTRGKYYSQQPVITASEDIAPILRKYFTKSKIETQEFGAVIFCTTSMRVIGVYMHTSGGINSTVMDVRLILAAALKLGATAIILAHNHPSGNLQPSDADIKITAEIKKAAKLMDIRVIDHVIVTADSYTSLMEKRLM